MCHGYCRPPKDPSEVILEKINLISGFFLAQIEVLIQIFALNLEFSKFLSALWGISLEKIGKSMELMTKHGLKKLNGQKSLNKNISKTYLWKKHTILGR